MYVNVLVNSRNWKSKSVTSFTNDMHYSPFNIKDKWNHQSRIFSLFSYHTVLVNSLPFDLWTVESPRVSHDLKKEGCVEGAQSMVSAQSLVTGSPSSLPSQVSSGMGSIVPDPPQSMDDDCQSACDTRSVCIFLVFFEGEGACGIVFSISRLGKKKIVRLSSIAFFWKRGRSVGISFFFLFF